jgi:hypothetical protein
MDTATINGLRARNRDAIASAETYRDRASAASTREMRDFYHSVAVTYEWVSRDITLLLETVDRVAGLDPIEQAANQLSHAA